MGVKFKLRVDGAEPLDFEARHSTYSLAVMEAFGKLKLPFPCRIEIWVPELLPEYGPYHYRIADFVDAMGNTYGCPSIMTAVPAALGEKAG